jgi:Methyl-accepting chemotaxis protein (MCP) signalling domain
MLTALDQSRPGPIANESASSEDESDVSALIARLTAEVNQIACEKTRSIQQITNQMKMLALNALIESSRARAQGAGFAVVAQEVRGVGQQVETIAKELEGQLTKRTGNLMDSIARVTERSRGERLVLRRALVGDRLRRRRLRRRAKHVSHSTCFGTAGGDSWRLYGLSRSLAL